MSKSAVGGAARARVPAERPEAARAVAGQQLAVQGNGVRGRSFCPTGLEEPGAARPLSSGRRWRGSGSLPVPDQHLLPGPLRAEGPAGWRGGRGGGQFSPSSPPPVPALACTPRRTGSRSPRGSSSGNSYLQHTTEPVSQNLPVAFRTEIHSILTLLRFRTVEMPPQSHLLQTLDRMPSPEQQRLPASSEPNKNRFAKQRKSVTVY